MIVLVSVEWAGGISCPIKVEPVLIDSYYGQQRKNDRNQKNLSQYHTFANKIPTDQSNG